MRPRRGTECAPCRERGHRCEAVIFVDQIPVCMACADGEACVFDRCRAQKREESSTRTEVNVFGEIVESGAASPVMHRTEELGIPATVQEPSMAARVETLRASYPRPLTRLEWDHDEPDPERDEAADPSLLKPAQDDSVEKCEVVQEEVNVKSEKKVGRRIPEEIRAKVVAEPGTVSNQAVADKFGLKYATVWAIRKDAGIAVVHVPHTERKSAPRTAKPVAIEKKLAHKQAAIKYRRALATRPVQVVHADPRKFSITVQISEAEADAYWRALTPEQKAATIGLQFQSIIDERVGAGA